MRWTYWPKAGFRFSLTDFLAIVICAAVTVFAWPYVKGLALLAPIVLGHFFLFCNIFRIRRSYELIWAAAFIANVGWQVINAGTIEWWKVMAMQTPITLLFIVMEMRGGRYHGIGYRWINPGAENYERPKSGV